MKSGKSRAVLFCIACCAMSVFFANPAHANITSKKYNKTNTFNSKKFNKQKKFDASGAETSLTKEKLERESFYRNKESARWNGERAYTPQNSTTSGYTKEKYHKNKQGYDTPEYQRELGKWMGNKREFSPGEIQDDMSKKYLGNIDVNVRNAEHQKFLDEYYSHVEERSMREINKYFFREGHNDDPGIATVKAGGGELEDESAFWEFLSNRKTIKRKPISLMGRSSTSGDPDEADEEGAAPNGKSKSKMNKKRSDEPAVREVARNSPRQGAQLRAPMKKRDFAKKESPPKKQIEPKVAPSSNAIMADANRLEIAPKPIIPPQQTQEVSLVQQTPQISEKAQLSSKESQIITKELDAEKVKNFEFMRVPKELSTGKASIKAEVKKPDW